MDNKENPSINEEVVETVAPSSPETPASEDPLAKGRERIAAIGSFFTKAKEKISSVTSRVGSGISRFFSRSGKVLGTGAAAIFSADVLAKKGAEWTDKKYGELVENADQKIDKAEEWIADKADNADKWMSETAEQAGMYVGEKYAQGKEWVGEVRDAGAEKYRQFEDLCGRGAQNVEEFIERSALWAENKVDRAKEITIEGVEIAKDVAFAVQTKTTEAFAHAKEGVKNQYNNAVEFGENVLIKAKVGWANTKEKFRGAYNNWRVARLNAGIERDMQEQERLGAKVENDKQEREKLLAKLQGKTALLSGINQLEVAA